MKNNQVSVLVRFCNFLIDSFIIAIIVFLVVSIIARFTSAINEYNVVYNRVLGFLIYFSYYFLCEISFSSTPGKLITKTKIADKITFNNPSVLKVFIRTLCRLIPFEALTILFYSDNLLWHDKISRTTVIKYN
jgi:uncharacterized RDD family membrane protein YckC